MLTHGRRTNCQGLGPADDGKRQRGCRDET